MHKSRTDTEVLRTLGNPELGISGLAPEDDIVESVVQVQVEVLSQALRLHVDGRLGEARANAVVNATRGITDKMRECRDPKQRRVLVAAWFRDMADLLDRPTRKAAMARAQGVDKRFAGPTRLQA